MLFMCILKCITFWYSLKCVCVYVSQKQTERERGEREREEEGEREGRAKFFYSPLYDPGKQCPAPVSQMHHLLWFLLLLFFETGSHSVTLAGFVTLWLALNSELHLLQPLKCWYYRVCSTMSRLTSYFYL